MAILLGSVAGLQRHFYMVLGLVLLILTISASRLFIARFSPPRSAPPLIKESGWTRDADFSTGRRQYLDQGKKQSQNGHFSFWYGTNHVVAISGHSARSAYLTSRGLDSTAGFIALFGGFLNISSLTNTYTRFIRLVYNRCAQDEHMVKNLSRVIDDSRRWVEQISDSQVIDPIDVIGRLEYQLMHRMVGSHDIADNSRLIDKTRTVYGTLEESSVLEAWFPMLPTPSKLKRLKGYTSLYRAMQTIVADRLRTGRTEDDAMQMMIDQGISTPVISLAIIGAIVAGVFNCCITAAWNLCHLAQNTEWRANIMGEIDAVINRHRLSESEEILDVLQRLTLKEWETEFPLLRLALKETLRFVMAGTIVRKNVGGKDLPISNTGHFIPRNSIAVYSVADVHMNEQLYKDPLSWDPNRHNIDRAEGTREPHAFLAWGSGNHPCPAERFSKLIMVVPTVFLLASYTPEMCKQDGKKVDTPLPELHFDRLGGGRPKGKVYIKFRLRT